MTGGEVKGGQRLDLTERLPRRLFGAPNQQPNLNRVQLSRISVHHPSQLRVHSYRSKNHSKSRQWSERRPFLFRRTEVLLHVRDSGTTEQPQRKERSVNLGKRIADGGWGRAVPEY